MSLLLSGVALPGAVVEDSVVFLGRFSSVGGDEEGSHGIVC